VDPKEKEFLGQYLHSRQGKIDVPIYGARDFSNGPYGEPSTLMETYRAEVDFYRGAVDLPHIKLSLNDVQRVADLIAMYREVL